MTAIQRAFTTHFDWADLPPLAEDDGSMATTAVYINLWCYNTPFQLLFVLGLVVFYLIHRYGCYIHTHWVPEAARCKIQREQFAGHVTSTVHSLMMTVLALVVVISYTPTSVYRASPDEPVILMWRTVAVMSTSYFAMDSWLMVMLVRRTATQKALFVAHHVLVATGMCFVFMRETNPMSTYLSAVWALVELSTVCLNARIFARMWRSERMYRLSGYAVLVSYPLTRMVWNPYAVWCCIPRLDYFGRMVVLALGGFITVLSAYYYLFFLLANPRSVYVLAPIAGKTTTDKIKKDC